MTINAKRLLKLADYLETVPRDRLDMSDFGRIAGCALGWAGYGKLFSELRRVPYGSGMAFTVRGTITGGFDAAEQVFSIDDVASRTLFVANKKNETPKQVAKRIRKFVRDNQVSAS